MAVLPESNPSSVRKARACCAEILISVMSAPVTKGILPPRRRDPILRVYLQTQNDPSRPSEPIAKLWVGLVVPGDPNDLRHELFRSCRKDPFLGLVQDFGGF